VLPLQILGPVDMHNIMRLQLAVMAPHSTIRQHMDSGGYAEAGHRIHVVVQTNPGTLGMPAQRRSRSLRPEARVLSRSPLLAC
jgi:hypothetical protein